MQPLQHSADLLGRYSALLCDIWGVVHNGVAVFPDALEALAEFRRAGGAVVLISNSPRPSPGVCAQLDGLGVSSDLYDAVVTSGDTIKTLLAARPGVRVFHLGPERDRNLMDGLDLELVDIESAECVLCSGLVDDESETPDDYEGLLGDLAGRGLRMYCANPDRVVHRGENLIYCAGALASRYAEIGGEVVMAGKPYAPIYDLAFEKLTRRLGKCPDRSEVLAIGDGVPTDLAGAAGAGLDMLFVTSGIHGLEVGDTLDQPEPEALDRFVSSVLDELPALKLVGTQARLRW